MADLMLQCRGVVALRRMIIDRIQDKFLDGTVAVTNNIVAYILKLDLLLHASLILNSPKSDLIIFNIVHSQERLIDFGPILRHEENKPD